LTCVGDVPVRSFELSSPSEGVACEHRSSTDGTIRLHSDLPKHGGLGNPSTNEEVNMAAAKKKAPAKKAAKKKGKKK
jgi:hypothetical protein